MDMNTSYFMLDVGHCKAVEDLQAFLEISWWVFTSSFDDCYMLYHVFMVCRHVLRRENLDAINVFLPENSNINGTGVGKCPN